MTPEQIEGARLLAERVRQRDQSTGTFGQEGPLAYDVLALVSALTAERARSAMLADEVHGLRLAREKHRDDWRPPSATVQGSFSASDGSKMPDLVSAILDVETSQDAWDIAHAIYAESQALEEMLRAEIPSMLIAKNAAYGNSALEPLRIFSKAPADEQISVRIDDKISRLERGSEAGEDSERDLLGYLVLRRVARRLSRSK